MFDLMIFKTQQHFEREFPRHLHKDQDAEHHNWRQLFELQFVHLPRAPLHKDAQRARGRSACGGVGRASQRKDHVRYRPSTQRVVMRKRTGWSWRAGAGQLRSAATRNEASAQPWPH